MRPCVPLCLSLLLLSAVPAMAMAGSARLSHMETDELIAAIDGRDASLVGWTLSGISGRGQAQRELTHRLDGEAVSRHLRLQGTIAGEELDEWVRDAGGWQAFELADGLAFRLAQQGRGVTIEKRWLRTGEPYRLRLELRIAAEAGSIATDDSDSLRLQIGPGIGEEAVEGLGIAAGMYSFTEAIFEESDRVVRRRLDTENARFRHTAEGVLGWAGLHSRYFAVVVAPMEGTAPFAAIEGRIPQAFEPLEEQSFFLTELDLAIAPFSLEPGETHTLSYVVYGGPKARSALVGGSPDLGEMLFPGLWQWMRLLALGIMYLLSAIHVVVPSWGLAIIVLAVLVRIAMYPIAANAMRAQKRFSEIQSRIRPEMDEIRRNYKGGEQSERILELYEKHDVSPLAGLKPLLIVAIQIPIFVALFHLLGQTFELRDASFLWMSTLAEPDRLFPIGVDLPFFGGYFNLLPVLMAVTTLASIRLSPAPSGSSQGSAWQNGALILMTAGFFLLFYPFPSGMVLYWTMANVLHLGHGLYAQRSGHRELQ